MFRAQVDENSAKQNVIGRVKPGDYGVLAGK